MVEVVSEMDYLRSREQKLRDTNESTNTRVKWFGFGTTIILMALWVWQILYLRAYFRFVPLFVQRLHNHPNTQAQVQASHLIDTACAAGFMILGVQTGRLSSSAKSLSMGLGVSTIRVHYGQKHATMG